MLLRRSLARDGPGSCSGPPLLGLQAQPHSCTLRHAELERTARTFLSKVQKNTKTQTKNTFLWFPRKTNTTKFFCLKMSVLNICVIKVSKERVKTVATHWVHHNLRVAGRRKQQRVFPFGSSSGRKREDFHMSKKCQISHVGVCVFSHAWREITNHRPDFGTSRDGRSHGYSHPDTERTAEWTERRGDAAGDGQVPLRVFGQGPSRVLTSNCWGRFTDVERSCCFGGSSAVCPGWGEG